MITTSWELQKEIKAIYISNSKLFKPSGTSPVINKLLPVAGTLPALRTGMAFARDAREIATAWSRYHQDVMRHTSEASQALLRAGTFREILEVQAKLLHGTTQSFHDQILKIAETTCRMATRPHDALKEATAEQAGD